jgi:phospholipase C
VPIQYRRHTGKKFLAALASSTIIASGVATSSLAENDAKTTTPITHLVIIFGENRSFDNYFATYPSAQNEELPLFYPQEDTPSVNGLTSALLTSNLNLANPFRLGREDAYTCSFNHDYTAEQKAVNGGLLDKFVQASSSVGTGCARDGSTVMGYYDGNTVTGLWNYAQHYTINDNSFDTNFGPSTPGALNLISGQTGNGQLALTFSKGQVATFMPVTVTGDPDPALDDCGADAGGTATGKGTVQMTGRNIGDLLNLKGVTWGWFEGGFAPTSAAVVNPDGSTKTAAVCASSHIQHQYGTPPVLVVPNPQINPGADIHTVGSTTRLTTNPSNTMPRRATRTISRPPQCTRLGMTVRRITNTTSPISSPRSKHTTCPRSPTSRRRGIRIRIPAIPIRFSSRSSLCR